MEGGKRWSGFAVQVEKATNDLSLLLTSRQLLFWCTISRTSGRKKWRKLKFSCAAIIFMCLGHLAPIFAHTYYCRATGTCGRANLKSEKNSLGGNTDQSQVILLVCHSSCANCKTQITLFCVFEIEKLPCPWQNVERYVCSLGCLKTSHL